MAGLTPVSPGSKLRISASDFNACLDAARAYRFGKRGEQDPQTIEAGGNVILVRNDSGSDCDELSVLGLDVPVILPTENLASWRRRLAFSGIVPTADHAGKFCVLQEPIAAGSIGRAVVSGVFQCVLNVADEDDTHADAAVGVVSSLITGTSGSAKIVWKESGTGVVYGVVAMCGDGKSELNANGLILPNGGGITTYDSAGTYAPTPIAKNGIIYAWVRAAGGGGGRGASAADFFVAASSGGSPTSQAYIVSAGGGGGQGGILIAAIKYNAGDTIGVVVGAGGNKATGNNIGTAGGVSSITVGGVTLTASGGLGGGGDGTSEGKYRGGAGGLARNATGASGSNAFVVVADICGEGGQDGQIITTDLSTRTAYGGRGGGRAYRSEIANDRNGAGGRGDDCTSSGTADANDDGCDGIVTYLFADAE